MNRYIPSLTTVLLAAALLAGCSTVTAGNAVPEDRSSATAQPPPSSSSGAPRVENPLDISRYRESPCSALTEAQIEQNLGSDAIQTADTSVVPSCLWTTASDPTADISVVFGQSGISRIYAGQGTLFELFKPMGAIEGYPAAAYDTSDNRMTSGECTVEVGTSDTSAIDVGVTLFQESVGTKDPCDAAYQIAKLVIDNIRGGN